MAPSSRGGQSRAQVALVQLTNCFVNLPPGLVALLAQTVVQNVVVELQYQEPARSKENRSASQRSIYAGWTGFESKRKRPAIVGREAGRGSKEEIAVVEISTAFGRTLGLVEGQKVGVSLHVDPPLAHTINIEPLTPSDWEIIQLHADFLETNFLSQIRALPNPSFDSSDASAAPNVHPLTLHITSTSTVNIIVSSLNPPQPLTVRFARTSPNAEVIVAPKVRQRQSHIGGQSRSITSAGRRSAGATSSRSKAKGQVRRDAPVPSAVFLRPVDERVGEEWFDVENTLADIPSLAVWVDRDVLAGKTLRGLEWVSISIVKAAGLEPPPDPQQTPKTKKSQEDNAAGTHATKIVAKLLPWDDAPDARHCGLSSPLCSALGADGLVGGLVRVEAALPPLPRSAIKALKVSPFSSSAQKHSTGLRFGGDAGARIQVATAMIRSLYGGTVGSSTGILSGPLTNGLILPNPGRKDEMEVWQGGIIHLDVSSDSSVRQSMEKQGFGWTLGSEFAINVELQAEVPNPFQKITGSALEPELIPWELPAMIGIESFVEELFSDLLHSSSILLTGGLGSGKTGIARLLGHRLRSSGLYHTSYFSCNKLVTDETRISTIKETINRLFMTASWGARFGGRALVILDDLDKLCHEETELQVGNDNSRSRHISELVSSTVRQYCSTGSGVVLLATAQSKESMNNVIIGGHVVRKITNLKAPNKDGRRRILEVLAGPQRGDEPTTNGHVQHSRGSSTGDGAAWMDGSPPASPLPSAATGGFTTDKTLDFLDLAGQTDGYMPGDLLLLISRARSEALIRSISTSPSSISQSMTLTKEDFTCALAGFAPASLRNVTLQTSKTSFSSIGGLHETRKILLETLQYPTTYAPIFAQCPLRLRSGLLLYGYPGCGKTLLASAVASECGLNFISVKGPEILNKYIGASEKSVRDLFERAESAKPCVLFFDEFDSIAPKRGHDSTGVTDRVVNQMLTQMDGAEGLSGVYVLAATSRPDLIDPALLRPGRLDKSLLCDMPGLEDRLDILTALSRKLKMHPEILDTDDEPQQTLVEVAHRTAGFSGADLQAVVYNAHLEAIHDTLGDPGTSDPKDQTTSRKATRQPLEHDFLQFRFGEDEAPSAKPLLDTTTILAKFDDLKAERRRERQLRRGGDVSQAPPSVASANGGGGENGKGQEKHEVMIQWKHIEASLATTKSSISKEERRRLEGIYREFTVGRNGEMPQGEGPREVGGRSSLM